MPEYQLLLFFFVKKKGIMLTNDNRMYKNKMQTPRHTMVAITELSIFWPLLKEQSIVKAKCVRYKT